MLALSGNPTALFSSGMRMVLVCCCAFWALGWVGSKQRHPAGRGRQAGCKTGSKWGGWGQGHGQGLSPHLISDFHGFQGRKGSQGLQAA